MDPIVVVNLKAYENGIGEKALGVAQACLDFDAWIAPQAIDLREVSRTGVVTFAQHVDPIQFGSHTGATLPVLALQAGAVGTLINHAEKPLSLDEIEKTISVCKQVGLKTIVCAASLDIAKQIDTFSPDYIAIEIPELIGGDVSVVSADPSLISNAVSALNTPLLMGAGVHSGADLKKTLELGGVGVLLASAIVSKTDDPHAALAELYSELK